MRFLSRHFIAYLCAGVIHCFRYEGEGHVHFTRVRFTSAINLAEAAAPDDAVNGEVVHGEVDVEFHVLPLAEASEFVGFEEFREYVFLQISFDFF